MTQTITVTDYTIPGKAPVSVRQDEGDFCITIKPWLEQWASSADDARDMAIRLAKVERCLIEWNANEPF